ncbi:thioesterase II family protein [Streptomyces sp. NPDC086787]|uniref:thioesterase II family protein n=1 Tax=Streptomyces sp. NPDC086787 TaxID=3365759 RepID=UPI0037FCB852
MSQLREKGWLRSLTGVEAPAVRLLCFPHSGGSATAFSDWAAATPPGVDLVGVQYPGRGDRFVEDTVDDVAEMAGHTVAELLRLPRSRYVLFGHSLGAVVAYEAALLLRDMAEEPGKLCVSACLPPGHMRKRDIHSLPDDMFWEALVGLGGIAPEIAESAELRELLLPALRSDLRAHATYQPACGTKPLLCPVTCYHGSGDPLADEGTLARWAGVTTGDFALRVRPGGHFHVTGDVAGLVSDVLGPAPV